LKPSLEVGIELALARRNKQTVGAIEVDELELESTKGRYVVLRARVKAALQGSFDTAEKSSLSPDSRRSTSWPAVKQSVVSTSGNRDTSSTGIDGQNGPKLCDGFEDDSSDEFLTLLVHSFGSALRQYLS
jgi:hypothetical protein